MTISEAAQTVLKQAGKGLTVDEIYNEIIKQNLYTFKAEHPKSVVSQTLRKNSIDKNDKKSIIQIN